MGKKIFAIGFLAICIFLVIIVSLWLNVGGDGVSSEIGVVREPAVSIPPTTPVHTPKQNIGDHIDFDRFVKSERDYGDYTEVEIDINELSAYREWASDVYYSVMRERLVEYGEVRFSGYVVDVEDDENYLGHHSVYKISDSQLPDGGSNHIEVACLTTGEQGYAVGDYVTVQGAVEYTFTKGEIFVGCTFIEKDGKVVVALTTARGYDHDEDDSYTDITVSEINNDFNASIALLEEVLPRNRFAKTSGYFVWGPSTRSATSVRIVSSKTDAMRIVSSFDDFFRLPGAGCLMTAGSDYPTSHTEVQNGDYVTLWTSFGDNGWGRENTNNCVVEKVEKTAEPDLR